MKKVIRLTENDLMKIVKRVISEQDTQGVGPALRNQDKSAPPSKPTKKVYKTMTEIKVALFLSSIDAKNKRNRVLNLTVNQYSMTNKGFYFKGKDATGKNIEGSYLCDKGTIVILPNPKIHFLTDIGKAKMNKLCDQYASLGGNTNDDVA